MVLTHNKRPFANDESYQHACKHLRQLDCGGQLASFAEISSFRGITPDSLVSVDQESKDIIGQPQGDASTGVDNSCAFSVIDKEFKVLEGDLVVNGHSTTAVCKLSSPSQAASSDCDVAGSGYSNWLFVDDNSCHPAFKPSSQWDPNCEQNSFAEIQPASGNCERPPTSVAGGKELENPKASAFSENSAAKNADYSTSVFPSLKCFSHEDVEIEQPVRLFSFPGYFEDDYRVAAFSQAENVYSSIFDYPYRKLVAVGPNHQADIPAWKPQHSNNSSGRSDDSMACASTSLLCPASDHSLIDVDSSERWLGTSVMPMPESVLSALERRLQSRADCCCEDEGSIRCVREHVMEAREKLKQTLGQDTFMELGFCDMGEDVSQKWSDEEEQVFQEVVLSNPASLGKNFWDSLPQVFPCCSNKELVSYYFNVFMLRKRMEQNRLDPLNVDSDNDEWQESEDGEFEEEDDSVVESPIHGDDGMYSVDGQLTDIHEGSEDGDACADEIDKEGLCDVSEICIHDRAKNMQDHVEDHDVQDDSCTSYEGQQHGADSCGGPADTLETHYGLVEDHKVLHREYKNDGASGLNDNGYDVGHCDLRTWDVGYVHGADKDIDFLPTCNVIEEVLGKGSWEETLDGHGVSQVQQS